MNQLRPVIIVENDPSIREAFRMFLECEGFPVAVAENGQQGLEFILSYGGNCVVLLDLQMPLMTGQELLEILSKDENPAIRSAPVLVMTAKNENFEHPGIIGTLRKPFDLDHLRNRLQTLCRA